MRLVRCDQCRKEAEVCALVDAPDPWPAILTKNEDDHALCFCTYRCLSEWAQARVLIESAGGES